MHAKVHPKLSLDGWLLDMGKHTYYVFFQLSGPLEADLP